MSIHDYIIDHAGFNWQTLLENWAWLVPEHFTLWIMNRFGDLFIVLDDGSVHMMEVGTGTLKKAAESRADFASRLNDDDNANEWLMIPLVDQLVTAGKTLSKGECYSYRVPPNLGGHHTVENMIVLPVANHYAGHGSIQKQIKDVPYGTEIRINP
jgi:hypothetical protein